MTATLLGGSGKIVGLKYNKQRSMCARAKASLTCVARIHETKAGTHALECDNAINPTNPCGGGPLLCMKIKRIYLNPHPFQVAFNGICHAYCFLCSGIFIVFLYRGTTNEICFTQRNGIVVYYNKIVVYCSRLQRVLRVGPQ
jgi:hypothetical protein